MQRLRLAVFLFIGVYGLWFVWSGPYSLPGLADEGTGLVLLFGLGSTALVMWLCWYMGIVDEDLAPFHLFFRTLSFIPWITLEVIRSNIDVIRRIWTGGVDPVVVKVQAEQKSTLGRVLFGNSITLTPGTLTLDAEEDTLTVHALSREGARDLEEGRMNRRVARLEGGE